MSLYTAGFWPFFGLFVDINVHSDAKDENKYYIYGILSSLQETDTTSVWNVNSNSNRFYVIFLKHLISAIDSYTCYRKKSDDLSVR